MELLLRRGAWIDAVDSFGSTPLFRATFDSRGRGDMITTLLRAGADPNQFWQRIISEAIEDSHADQE